jgi:hypothetical protein
MPSGVVLDLSSLCLPGKNNITKPHFRLEHPLDGMMNFAFGDMVVVKIMACSEDLQLSV